MKSNIKEEINNSRDIEKNKKMKREQREDIKKKNNELYKEILKKDTAKNPIKTFFRLVKFLKYEKKMFALGIVLSIITTVLGIASNLILKPIIDEIAAGNLDNFISQMLLYAGLGFLSILLGFIGSAALAIMAQKIIATMRTELFEHMETLSIEYFDKNQSGDIMSVYSNDIELLSTALDQSVVKILISILQVIITLGILIYLNWILALVIIGLLIIYTFGITFFGFKAEKHSKIKQHRLGDLNAYSEELISGMQTVKVFNYEDRNIEIFEDKSFELKDSSVRSQIYGIAPHAVSHFLSSALLGVIGIVGGILQVKGHITLGMIVVYIQFVRNLTQPIETIANQFATLATALAGAERVFAILDTEPEIDEGTVTIETKDNQKYWNRNGELLEAHGHIEFENVDFGYNEESLALENISLWAKPCQKIAFVGSTGAGKTTVSNLINRFYEINSGVITIDGIDITEIKKRDLRENITTVLQDTTLFTGTIKDNIKYGNINATDEEVIEAAKLSNADTFIQNLPDKYDTIINPDDMSLSQGEMQLLSIARAAVSRPLILMLDEATSSIDTKTEQLVHKGLDNLMKQYTTLVIAHRLSTIKNANAIMVIDQGKIIERGDHDELLEQKGKYYNLHTGREALI